MGSWKRGESTDPVTGLSPPPQKGVDNYGAVEKGRVHGPYDQTEATTSKKGVDIYGTEEKGTLQGPCDRTVATTSKRGGQLWDRGEGVSPRTL